MASDLQFLVPTDPLSSPSFPANCGPKMAPPSPRGTLSTPAGGRVAPVLERMLENLLQRLHVIDQRVGLHTAGSALLGDRFASEPISEAWSSTVDVLGDGFGRFPAGRVLGDDDDLRAVAGRKRHRRVPVTVARVPPRHSAGQLVTGDPKSHAVSLTTLDGVGHVRQEIWTKELAAEERREEGRDVVDRRDDPRVAPDGAGDHRDPEPRTLIRRPDGRRPVAGVLEVERTKDPIEHDAFEGAAGHLLHDLPEEDVVGVRVREACPGREHRRADAVADQPARVFQELSDGDRTNSPEDPGKESPTVSCSDRRRSPTSWRTTVATKVLVVLWIWNRSCGSAGRPGSASPKAPRSIPASVRTSATDPFFVPRARSARSRLDVSGRSRSLGLTSVRSHPLAAMTAVTRSTAEKRTNAPVPVVIPPGPRRSLRPALRSSPPVCGSRQGPWRTASGCDESTSREPSG